MNLYVRYFDHEVLAYNVNEAMSFLATIREIKIDSSVAQRIQSFLDSNNTYPFRLKVSYSNYVLFLKTEAKSIEEFKYLEQLRKENKGDGPVPAISDKKRSIISQLAEERFGWYEATIIFKRVVPIPDTNKFQYKDTRFKVRLKASSGMDCYERIISHLRNRQDVDKRSQYPSAKSSNFIFEYLENKEQEDNSDTAPVDEAINTESTTNYAVPKSTDYHNDNPIVETGAELENPEQNFTEATE